MRCKDCFHYERIDDDAFYCEAYNELFYDGNENGAEQCNQFKPFNPDIQCEVEE